MRYLLTAMVLALCACGSADNVTSAGAASSGDTRSASNVTSSVNSNTSSNVTSSVNNNSSTNVGGTTTNSTSSNSSTTSCSTEVNGRRCEVSCNAPLVAQCVKSTRASEPTCNCK